MSHGIKRMLFGNYQGAITAFISGLRDKLNTFITCKNWKEEDIISALENTKSEADKYLEEFKKYEKIYDEESSKLLDLQDELFKAKMIILVKKLSKILSLVLKNKNIDKQRLKKIKNTIKMLIKKNNLIMNKPKQIKKCGIDSNLMVVKKDLLVI